MPPFLLRFSQTCKVLSSKAACMIAFFIAVNHNYDHKQQTLKHRNTQNGSKSTNHKPWPFEPIKVKFCYLRGLLRWLTAVKNAIVSWLLNFTIWMFVKSAVITSFCKNSMFHKLDGYLHLTPNLLYLQGYDVLNSAPGLSSLYWTLCTLLPPG